MVSVILPNYNHAPYLQKRIESILNQTYTHFELIILDDCSTDNSREIIETYRNNPHVKHIIYNETNSGSPFIQWQKGFELALGEYIWIAESDDYADTRFLEMLLPAFTERSTVGVVYSDSNEIDAKDNLKPEFYKKAKNILLETNKWDTDYLNNGLNEIKENLFYVCTINNTSAMVFKKSLLQYIDFEKLNNFKYCGDWYFFIALLSHCDVAYKKDALNYFKQGTDNFGTGTKSALNYFKERFMVRYYFWENVKSSFSKAQKRKLYKGMGKEMSLQINEAVKGKSNLSSTVQSFKLLRHTNKSLFRSQFTYMIRAYVHKVFLIKYINWLFGLMKGSIKKVILVKD